MYELLTLLAWWVFGNLVVFILLMYGTVFYCAWKLMDYNRGLIEELSSEGEMDRDKKEDYLESQRNIKKWDIRRPLTLLSIVFNAPVLFYELVMGRYDILEYAEFGGFFYQKTLKGLYRMLCYGAYMAYRETKDPLWIIHDKDNTGNKIHILHILIGLVFWFMIPALIAKKNFALYLVSNFKYALVIYRVRKAENIVHKLNMPEPPGMYEMIKHFCKLMGEPLSELDDVVSLDEILERTGAGQEGIEGGSGNDG